MKKNQKSKTDFRRVINDNQKRLEYRIARHNKFANQFKWLFNSLLFLLLLITALVGITGFYDGIYHELFGFGLSSGLTMTLFLVLIYPSTHKITSPKGELETTNWRRGRVIIFILWLIYLLLLFVLHYYEFDFYSQSALVSGFWSFLGFTLLYLYVRYDPSKIQSRTISIFGSGFLYVTVVMTIFSLGFKWIDSIPMVVFSMVSGVLSPLVFWLIIRKRKLNIFQIIALNTISPNKILNSLREEWQKNKDKIEALNLLVELEKKGKYGVREELIRELVKSNPVKGMSFILPMLMVLGFVLKPIIEGLIQEAFLEKTKILICDLIGMLC